MLQITSGLCFIGHGAFGIITKVRWLPYFAVVNIGPDTAYTLMPLIGHGGFGAVQNKHMLMDHFATMGLPFGDMDHALFLRLVGIFEIPLGVVVLFIKFPPILLVIPI